MDVIENPDVAQALRQDKMQNLHYLKENYNVRVSSNGELFTAITAVVLAWWEHTRSNTLLGF